MGCEVEVGSRKPWGQTRQFEQRAWRVNMEAWMPVSGRRVRLMEGVKVGSEWGVERRGLSVRSGGGEVSKRYGMYIYIWWWEGRTGSVGAGIHDEHEGVFHPCADAEAYPGVGWTGEVDVYVGGGAIEAEGELCLCVLEVEGTSWGAALLCVYGGEKGWWKESVDGSVPDVGVSSKERCLAGNLLCLQSMVEEGLKTHPQPRIRA